MKRVLRLAAGLAVALLLDLACRRGAGRLGEMVDPLLVVAIWFALSGRALPAQLGGAATGLLHDAVFGAMIGLHGFANTLVSFAVARGAQRLLAQQIGTLLLLLVLAAALQQATVFGLAALLLPQVDPPDPVVVAGRLTSTALLGLLLVHGEGFVRLRLSRWQRRRGSRLHFD